MNSRSLIFAVALVSLTGPAWAHAFLEHASPGAGDSAATAPKTVNLKFSQALNPKLSGVSVTDAAGHDMEAAAPDVKGESMQVTLKPLKAGSYHVAWHAISTDSHRTEGSYSFSVGN